MLLFQTYFLIPIATGGVKIISPKNPLTGEAEQSIVSEPVINVINDFPNIMVMKTLQESEGRVVKKLQSIFTMMDGEQQYICMTFTVEVDMSSNGPVLLGRETPKNPWQGKEPDWAKKFRG